MSQFKTLSYILLFSFFSIAINAQQRGLGGGFIFNSIGHDVLIGKDTSFNGDYLIFDNYKQRIASVSYFKTYKEGKRTHLFFCNFGYSSTHREKKSIFRGSSPKQIYELYDIDVQRVTAELGYKRNRVFLQSKNQKCQAGVSFSTALFGRYKKASPLRTIYFTQTDTFLGINGNVEPYLTFKVSPNLFLDVTLYKAFEFSTGVAFHTDYDPSLSLENRQYSYFNSDANVTCFNNVGVQIGIRYALKS